MKTCWRAILTAIGLSLSNGWAAVSVAPSSGGTGIPAGTNGAVQFRGNGNTFEGGNAIMRLNTNGNKIEIGGPIQSAITGGSARGTSANDLQLSRGAASQVPAGIFSSILGGTSNTVTSGGARSVVAGGDQNTVSGSSSFIGTGVNNLIRVGAITAYIGSGQNATIGYGTGSSIVNGVGNAIWDSFALDNTNDFSAILSGGNNNMFSSGDAAVISGGYQNSMGVETSGNLNIVTFGVIAGGYNNVMVSGTNNIIGGGQNNTINSNFSATISGGFGNTINAGLSFGTIAGGLFNLLSASDTVAIGGRITNDAARSVKLGYGETNLWITSTGAVFKNLSLIGSGSGDMVLTPSTGVARLEGTLRVTNELDANSVIVTNSLKALGTGDNGLDALYISNLTATAFALTDANKKLVSSGSPTLVGSPLINGALQVTNDGNFNYIVITNYTARLASDATSTSTTLANLGITCRVKTGPKYAFTCVLFVSDSIAADGVKIDFGGGTATATDFRAHGNLFGTVSGFGGHATSLTTTIAGVTVSTDNEALEIHGSFEPSAAGTFIPRFAQNGHTTGTLTVFKGSFLLMWEIP